MHAYNITILQDLFFFVVLGSLLYGVIAGSFTAKITTLLAYSSIIHMGYFLIPITVTDLSN